MENSRARDLENNSPIPREEQVELEKKQHEDKEATEKSWDLGNKKKAFSSERGTCSGCELYLAARCG